MEDASYGQSQESVDLSHPFHISLCQIIIDRYHVNAFSLQRVEICGQRRYQGLTSPVFISAILP